MSASTFRRSCCSVTSGSAKRRGKREEKEKREFLVDESENGKEKLSLTESLTFDSKKKNSPSFSLFLSLSLSLSSSFPVRQLPVLPRWGTRERESTRLLIFVKRRAAPIEVGESVRVSESERAPLSIDFVGVGVDTRFNLSLFLLSLSPEPQPAFFSLVPRDRAGVLSLPARRRTQRIPGVGRESKRRFESKAAKTKKMRKNDEATTSCSLSASTPPLVLLSPIPLSSRTPRRRADREEVFPRIESRKEIVEGAHPKRNLLSR